MKNKLSTWLALAGLLLLGGCAARFNAIELETRANDPLMTHLMDNDIDLAQIEDGTGFVGEATSCPT